MKKLMITIAATVALVSVASAADQWFAGFPLGAETGGEWVMTPGDGEITTNDTTLVLDDAAATFNTITLEKSNYRYIDDDDLQFVTTAKFMYSYDELPAIEPDAKAGIVVVNDKFYVLAKDESTDGGTNMWVDTGIEVESLSESVAITVTITNGSDTAHALYQLGESASIIDKPVSFSDYWSRVDYKGSGEVSWLVANTIPHGYPTPSGKTIPTETANTWAIAHDIAVEDLQTLLASNTKYNGRTVAESCLLGVGTNDNIVATIADTVATKLSFAIVCTPTIADRVKFALKKDGVAGEKQTATAFTPDVAAGIYQIVAYVDDVEVPASQEIGVKGTAVDAEKVYFIGAPWDDCLIADLFKKTCCAAGDKLEVYDAQSDRWLTWTMEGGAWKYIVDANIDGDTEPVGLTLKKGQAVKYSAATATADGANLYQVGNVSAVGTTAIIAGGDSGAMWNLVASPSAPIAAADLPLDSTKARALVLGGDDGITAQKIYLKVGGVLYVKSGWDADPVEVKDAPVLEGAFFLKTKEATSLTWSAAVAQ